MLKFFCPKAGTANAKRHNWLGYNQTGGRKDMNAIETVTFNELIIEYHRLTRNSLCIHQVDSTGCFDKIVMNHTILNSRKYHIPSIICKVQYETQDNMTYATQIKNRISKVSYTSTEKCKMYRVGQGSGNGGIHWNFNSIPMIEVIDKLAKQY